MAASSLKRLSRPRRGNNGKVISQPTKMMISPHTTIWSKPMRPSASIMSGSGSWLKITRIWTQLRTDFSCGRPQTSNVSAMPKTNSGSTPSITTQPWCPSFSFAWFNLRRRRPVCGRVLPAVSVTLGRCTLMQTSVSSTAHPVIHTSQGNRLPLPYISAPYLVRHECASAAYSRGAERTSSRNGMMTSQFSARLRR